MDFDGVDDKVDHGDIAGVDSAAALTTMFWIMLDVATSGKGIFGKNNELTIYTVVGGDGTDLGTGQSGVWGMNTAVGALVVATWVHIAVVFDGSLAAADRAKIYKNGVSQSLSGSTAGTTLSDQGTAAVTAGTNSLGFIDAKLAHVKVWTAALTAAEIVQEMNADGPERTANLVLWAPYDDGTSARDYSGSGNHGTVTGAVQVAGPPISSGASVLVV